MCVYVCVCVSVHGRLHGSCSVPLSSPISVLIAHQVPSLPAKTCKGGKAWFSLGSYHVGSFSWPITLSSSSGSEFLRIANKEERGGGAVSSTLEQVWPNGCWFNLLLPFLPCLVCSCLSLAFGENSLVVVHGSVQIIHATYLLEYTPPSNKCLVT